MTRPYVKGNLLIALLSAIKYTITVVKRKRENTCGHWDCKKPVAENSFLCSQHYEDWTRGLMDRCPKCGRFKEVKYQLCLDCYFGRPVATWEPRTVIPTSKQYRKVEYSDTWVDGYMRPDRFFVYILELDGGYLYVGHTEDLRKRLAEHREQKIPSAPGYNPKLQYVQIVATQKVAELHEDELKRLLISNPEQIHLMIDDFCQRMRELGFEQDS